MPTNVKAKDLNYDKYSRMQYDRDIRLSIPGHVELHREIAKFAKTLKNINKLLDLGPGTGITTKAILLSHPKAECNVIDISKQMLKGAKERLKKYNVKYTLGDYAKVQFPKDNDIISTVIGFHHQKTNTDKKRLFKKIYKALKPKGYFIFGDLVTYKNPKEAALNEAFHYKYLVDNHESKKSLVEWTHHHKFLNCLAPLEAQLEWLKEIGFKTKVVFKKFNTVLIIARKS